MVTRTLHKRKGRSVRKSGRRKSVRRVNRRTTRRSARRVSKRVSRRSTRRSARRVSRRTNRKVSKKQMKGGAEGTEENPVEPEPETEPEQQTQPETETEPEGIKISQINVEGDPPTVPQKGSEPTVPQKQAEKERSLLLCPEISITSPLSDQFRNIYMEVRKDGNTRINISKFLNDGGDDEIKRVIQEGLPDINPDTLEKYKNLFKAFLTGEMFKEIIEGQQQQEEQEEE